MIGVISDSTEIILRVVQRTPAVFVRQPHVCGPAFGISLHLSRPVRHEHGAVRSGRRCIDRRIHIETRARQQTRYRCALA